MPMTTCLSQSCLEVIDSPPFYDSVVIESINAPRHPRHFAFSLFIRLPPMLSPFIDPQRISRQPPALA
jgi:hypothetical protein